MNEKIFQIYYDRAKFFFERTAGLLFAATEALEIRCCNSGGEIVPYRERLAGTYVPIREGEVWGKPWDSAWFQVTGQIPEAWRGEEVVLWFDFGSEALIYDDGGVPYYGLSVSSIFDVQYKKEFFPFAKAARGGETIDLWIEGAANQLFGMYMNMSPELDEEHPHGTISPVIRRARAGIFRSAVWHLRLDFEVLLGLCETIADGDYRKHRILAAMTDAIDAFADNPANAGKARAALQKAMPPAMASALTVTAVGHAHIDTGWLWRVRESVRKCARTFANQLYNIEHYPGYVFGASQAQHYAFAKQHYPELYEKVKKAVRDGSWELQGGMWVEADCNLISGESMVRQFLHGKNFFRDEFGEEVRNVWIPDVFGYSAAMPQICRQAGCDFFLTQKISWSQINRFPYNTFLWEGIDGSSILTHFPPEDTYIAEMNPNQLVPAQNRYSENAVSDEFVSLYGIGDGGGGPKAEYIERALRMRNLEGAPKVRFGKAQEAFDRMKQLEPKLARWVGELYLELHRGTFTTQGRVKKGNRELEQRLTAIEVLLSALPESPEAAEIMDWNWKKLLLNQFHDILPGSSITEVYVDTLKEYDEIRANCDRLQRQAVPVTNTDNARSLFNTLSIPWRGIVRCDGWDGCTASGAGAVAAQSRHGGTLEALVEIPALSALVLHRAGNAAAVTATDAPVLENERIRYEFAANGEITRIFDKERRRELLRSGQRGNVMTLYVDRPNLHEAWDHDIYYPEGALEHAVAAASAAGHHGATGMELTFALTIGNSEIAMTAALEPGSKQLTIAQRVDWQEDRRMLRVAFEADVRAKDAVCDIQYGYVRRVTHKNTSWELAKFEVPIHRYVDLTDEAQGFAVLNDCKYGVALAPERIDLALLKSPKYPDWTADRGIHEYRYAFLPHAAEEPLTAVIDAAAIFNRAPLAVAGALREPWQAPCRIDAAGIRIEVIKKAEKSADTIVRVVECAGKYSEGTLRVDPAFTLHDCDLLEWQEAGAPLAVDNNFALAMRPFEIRSFRLRRRA